MDFEDVVFVMEDIDCASSIVKARASDVADSKSTGYNMRNNKLNLSGLLKVRMNHLLQKAILFYLADVLGLKSKNAQYGLLEKTKKRPKTPILVCHYIDDR
ncbi:hypothetical protein PF007_g6479 [Phytophthora fragariae]|uniref:Uncharacterized protein n=2 Tax=Phytophthora fragariae TaxID=53985 RepID=A0A6A3SWX3_9STRA|nr:hypothetical protein PF007_g6479 [Phytophthora fragariae]